MWSLLLSADLLNGGGGEDGGGDGGGDVESCDIGSPVAHHQHRMKFVDRATS